MRFGVTCSVSSQVHDFGRYWWTYGSLMDLPGGGCLWAALGGGGAWRAMSGKSVVSIGITLRFKVS